MTDHAIRTVQWLEASPDGTLSGDRTIEALAIAVKEIAPDKATGTVRFKNFGKDVTITHDLVKLKPGWRIDEIRMPSGSLRALFKKK